LENISKYLQEADFKKVLHLKYLKYRMYRLAQSKKAGKEKGVVITVFVINFCELVLTSQLSTSRYIGQKVLDHFIISFSPDEEREFLC
jgi:hypothetical protein